MTTVISVENLSKTYRLGQIGTGTFTHDLNLWWAKMRGKPNPMLRIGEKDHGQREGEELWALKDVSFKVEQGEVLGIIGRNGAGKSTLLKILSRVTAPTSGRIRVKGRIASLLEVGTGFHPDLTGRENIYLNGAILGMSKPEISRKFDEIVDFAEVEKFIDTPVKRYSSGMYVRLAFAVAAHLDPEILVVDEVLAVGDAEFQKKCLGKMGEVAKGGRTVLFVSHNMGAIQNICTRGILLNKGSVLLVSDIEKCIIDYARTLQQTPPTIKSRQFDCVLDVSETESGKPLTVTAKIKGTNIICEFIFFVIEDDLGRIIIYQRLTGSEYGLSLIEGNYTISAEIPALWLNPGIYYIYMEFKLFNQINNMQERHITEKKPVLIINDLSNNIIGLSGHDIRGKNTIQAVLRPPIRYLILEK